MKRAVDVCELMDADDLAPATYADVLRDLAQVNTLTLARRPTLNFLDRLSARRGDRARPLRVLDVGFGDGDMLRALHAHAVRRGQRVALVGIDLNPRSVAAAQASTPVDMAIDYRTGDYADLAGEGWDAVISSLVAHHMTHDELVAFVGFMDREARSGWFVNDLYRSRTAQAGFGMLATMLRWHPIVRHDGALSVARSYRVAEWAPVLTEAGVSARVFRAFPYRLCVECVR